MLKKIVFYEEKVMIRFINNTVADRSKTRSFIYCKLFLTLPTAAKISLQNSQEDGLK